MSIRQFTISLIPTENGTWTAQCLEWDLCSMGFPDYVCGAQHSCIEAMIEAIQMTYEFNVENGVEKNKCPDNVWQNEWANGEVVIINVDLEGREKMLGKHSIMYL